MITKNSRPGPRHTLIRWLSAAQTCAIGLLVLLVAAGCGLPFAGVDTTGTTPTQAGAAMRATRAAAATVASSPMTAALPTLLSSEMPTLAVTGRPAAELPTSGPLPPTVAPELAACQPPPGWAAHVVQPEDTVYGLAASTNTTIEEIQRVNCLADPSLIYDGQILYVPAGANQSPAPTEVQPSPIVVQPAPTTEQSPPTVVPPIVVPPTVVPPTVVPPTVVPPTVVPCEAFNCGDDGLAMWPSSPGEPNGDTVTPCETPQEAPWINISGEAQMEQGQRRYFYACDFTTDLISASVTLSDGVTQPIDLFATPPNPDLPLGGAKAVIVWSAVPTQPIGLYTLVVADNAGHIASQEFGVELPTAQHILVVPPAAPPGATFQVYYVYFDLNTTPTFDFYGEDTPVIGAEHILSHRTTWQIAITQQFADAPGKGWAEADLSSSTGDLPAAYGIGYNTRSVTDLFWLR